MIWKFRFYLARDKRGLTKFLKSVTWRDHSEVKQAVEELLPMWTEVDTDDALELLGPGTLDSRVRAFAVRQLNRADDDVTIPFPIIVLLTPLTECFRNSCCIYSSSFRRSSLRVLRAISGRHGRRRAQYHTTTVDYPTS